MKKKIIALLTVCLLGLGACGEKRNAITDEQFWIGLEENGYTKEHEYFDETASAQLTSIATYTDFEYYHDGETEYMFMELASGSDAVKMFDTLVNSYEDDCSTKLSVNVGEFNSWAGTNNTDNKYIVLQRYENIVLFGYGSSDNKEVIKTTVDSLFTMDYTDKELQYDESKNTVDDENTDEVIKPTPTLEPTVAPTEVVVSTEVVEPTATPTEIVEPTKVVEPTATPTEIVEPTVAPTEIVEPTIAPTETAELTETVETISEYTFMVSDMPVTIPSVEGWEYDTEWAPSLYVKAYSKYNLRYVDSYIDVGNLEAVSNALKTSEYPEENIGTIKLNDVDAYLGYKVIDGYTFVTVYQNLGLETYLRLDVDFYDECESVEELLNTVSTFALTVRN